MLFRTPELDRVELDVCRRIEELRARFDTAAIAEWSHPLWSARLWRLMMSQACGAPQRRRAAATDSSAVALEAAGSALAADVAYRRAMTLALQIADDPTFVYSFETFKQLHYALAQDGAARYPGRFRRREVGVSREGTGEVWYTAPPHAMVPGLLDELIDHLNDTRDVPAVVHAAMAYLQFSLIHPFEDGNGRAARCLHTLALARAGFRSAAFVSLDQYFGRRTQQLCDLLAAVSGGRWQPERDVRPWVRFCLRGHLWQASRVEHTTHGLRTLADSLERVVADAGLSPRVMPLLLDAALGQRVTSGDGSDTRDVTRLLAGEHLDAAADAGLLVVIIEGRERTYLASDTLSALRSRLMERKHDFIDPFQSESASAVLGPSTPTTRDFWIAAPGVSPSART